MSLGYQRPCRLIDWLFWCLALSNRWMQCTRSPLQLAQRSSRGAWAVLTAILMEIMINSPWHKVAGGLRYRCRFSVALVEWCHSPVYVVPTTNSAQTELAVVSVKAISPYLEPWTSLLHIVEVWRWGSVNDHSRGASYFAETLRGHTKLFPHD